VGAFTERHALRVRSDRHEDHARELLADATAIVTSDRWWAYSHLPLTRRQVCWAHLRRDFKAHAEGLTAEKAFGEAGVRICDELFWAWEIYQHTRDRRELKRRVRALRRELKPILRTYAGKQARYRHTRGIARNLLKVFAVATECGMARIDERGPGAPSLERLLQLHARAAAPNPVAPIGHFANRWPVDRAAADEVRRAGWARP